MAQAPPGASKSREILPKSSKIIPSPRAGQMTTIHQLGPFRLDGKTATLFRGAEPVALGQRAVVLLLALVEHAGAPVSKHALIDAAWPGLSVEDSNLSVQIAALRRVLGEEPGGEEWIETLPRRGYRYVGPVEVTQRGISIAATDPPATAPLTLPDKPSIALLPFQNL